MCGDPRYDLTDFKKSLSDKMNGKMGDKSTVIYQDIKGYLAIHNTAILTMMAELLTVKGGNELEIIG